MSYPRERVTVSNELSHYLIEWTFKNRLVQDGQGRVHT